MQEAQHRPVTGVQQFLLFAGVIMPAISITVEATTHMCAETFFDPIPSTWHLMLVTFVPIAQLHVWFTIRRGTAQNLRLTGWLNALALGVSIFYAFVYLPLMPAAALTLLFIIGLLPLAPVLSMVAALVMRQHLAQMAAKAPPKKFIMRKVGLLAGLFIVAAFIGLLELPASITRYGLRKAASDIPEISAEGIRFLRSYGSTEYLLRSCYGRHGAATDFIGFLITVQDPVTPTKAREIYYRVTGETFDTSLPPRRTGGRVIPQDEFDFDSDQGGVKIGGKLKGLSLSSSKIDATADAHGGVAYMQWTLVFQNEALESREARTEVQLPPGAVVSRLTLWVNGEEREAAFAGRAKARAAYQQVAIRQRRDPVLVTTAGRDRILVQCFPVPPGGGSMKVRIGITIPLLLEDTNHARLLFPHFLDRNFRIPDNVSHATWIESKTGMSSASKLLMTSEFTDGRVVMGGGIPERQMSKPETSIMLARQNIRTWSKDPFEKNNFIIQQSIDARHPLHLYRIVLVVDTSAAMEEFNEEIKAAIKSLPPEFDVKLVLADAEKLKDFTASGIEGASSALDEAVFLGGADNVPALIKAWELAAEKPGNNAIVWIHAPQLLQIRSAEDLVGQLEDGRFGPALYSVQTKSGSDVILKGLDGINHVKTVPRTGNLDVDLKKLFQRLTGQASSLEFVRTSTRVENLPDPAEGIETSDHIARLWANDEVARILSVRDESLHEAATMLAVRYQLVTPVSGAVVLETAEQYQAAGLNPVDKGTVPTIPEPEMIALLAVVGVLLTWLIYRKRRMIGGRGCPI